MSSPAWLKTASNHAMINMHELCEWVGLGRTTVTNMLAAGELPKPRLGGGGGIGGTRARRWRVGDVRAALAGSPKRLEAALATPLGDPASNARHGSPELRADFLKRIDAARPPVVGG